MSESPIRRRIVSSADQSRPCALSAREKLSLASGSLSTSTPSQSKITNNVGLLFGFPRSGPLIPSDGGGREGEGISMVCHLQR